ncbi:acyl-CoA Delta(11) desaturase-like [Plodia interpunctella]|uniref:acyl-CoA Delta(11) desaturase-like n=1 Tax=Plodia interpunctella TaxID=58824 RepID=UPI002368C730|nr:acyl-CoA Delta(11) desaturase-like [Plodia interpunctella]
MAPHAESEAKFEEEAPRFEKLVAPSADSYKIRPDPIEYPIMLAYFLFGIYASYLALISAKLTTILFSLLMVIPGMIGVTAGVHRLWSHRSYKVKPQLEILLTMFYLLSNQRSIITWARRHHLHHQCADTDADPHNAQRGFWFSHYGWTMMEPHPEVNKRIKYMDVSYLFNNPIVKFQHDYFVPLVILVTYVIPVYIPTLWGESLYASFMANMLRMHITLHLSCCINSVTHLIGYKPIDITAVGTQTRLAGIMIAGEGFHNYHHAFPYDYRASEFGDTKYNLGAMFIELMAKIGWAYDLKVTSEEVVKNRVLKKGDGTDQYYIPNNPKKQKFFTTQFYKNIITGDTHDD